MRTMIAGLSSLAFCLSAAADQTINGPALVVDGDTLEINGRQVRLLGIDAPEAAQVLPLPTGGRDFFGRGAALVLRSMVQENKITCKLSSQDDKRGVKLATCFSGKSDLGAEMVSRGMAWATTSYPSPYAAVEQEAQRKRRGLWRDSIERPWFFSQAAAAGCCQ